MPEERLNLLVKFGVILKFINKVNNTIEILTVQSQPYNKWGFPKGKRNSGESPIDCAIRELFEETGVYIHSSYLLKSKFSIINRIGYFIVECYNKPIIINISPLEITNIKWMTYKDLNEISEICTKEVRTSLNSLHSNYINIFTI